MDNFEEKVLEYLAKLTQDMTEIRQDIKLLTDRVSRIEVKIENDVSPKLTTLFDGWQQHNEQLNRIEEKVSTHEEFIIKRIK